MGCVDIRLLSTAILLSLPLPRLQQSATEPQEPAQSPDVSEPEQDPDPDAPRTTPAPWDVDLTLLRSTNGSTWNPVGVLTAGASSPTLCRLSDGRLLLAHQSYSADNPDLFDRVALRTSEDDGNTWSKPEPLALTDLPQGLRQPFDPYLVALDDGRARLYFSSHAEPAAEDGSYGPDGWPSTYSAISSDGSTWTFEPGKRFGIEGLAIGSPCVARFRDEWHYFAPVPDSEGSAFHALSRDGLSFQRLPEVELDGSGRWLGCALAEDELGEADALLRFFGTDRIGWSATSRDGARWRQDGRVMWGQYADPSVVRLRDGSWLMVATSPSALEPEDDALALLSTLAGTTGVAMTANNRYLYVLRDDTIYMYDATTLRLLRLQRLPPEATAPRSDEPGPGSRVGPARRSRSSVRGG